MTEFLRITRNPAVMQGKACIRGMRFPVQTLLRELSAGTTVEELLREFPFLEREDVSEALKYASWLTSEREFEVASTEAAAIAQSTLLKAADAPDHLTRPKPRYGVTFDLDADTLQRIYPGELWEHAFVDVRAFLEGNGFQHKQGSLFLADDSMDPVTCVVTVQRLADALNWFRSSVRSLRLLRIEDDIDLKPALDLMTRRAG